MHPKSNNRKPLLAGSLTVALALLACNLSRNITPTPIPPVNTIPADGGMTDTPAPSASDTPEPSATFTGTPTQIIHAMMPGELPAGALSELTDRISATTASQKRATGGDDFSTNLYERPFNANSMDTYFPDLDFARAILYTADPWVYVNLTLAGTSQGGGLKGIYGVEIDTNVDGRGDVLVMASNPGAQWSVEGVRAWKDSNGDVGGAHPASPDANAGGDGYDTLVFDAGAGADADLAWARLSPADPASIQFAFKHSLIDNDSMYAWGVWAMDASTFDPAKFDFNDHYTAEEIGSPLVEMKQLYPVKTLAELDNTCRWSVGFTPSGSEPGLCPKAVTPTPALPGTITGKVFNDDVDKDGVFGNGSYPYQNIPIEVRKGNCSGDVAATTASNMQGDYSVSVPAGAYCVQITNRPDPGGAAPRQVTVPNGGTVQNVDFAFWSQ